MMRRVSLLFLILLYCFSGLSAQTSLKSRLDELLKQDFLKTSEVGIAVYDLTAGRSLYRYQDKKLYRPASVQKLITSIAGLSLLGGDYRFETALRHSGEIVGDTLYGDLWVVGGFDPEFDEVSMDSLVNMVTTAGIRVISGRLVGDDSLTDSLYWGEGWSWDDNPYYFQPYLSPLMYNKGCVKVTAYPSHQDSTALVYCEPHSDFYRVENHTVSRRPEAGKFNVTRNWLEDGNTVIVEGDVSTKRTDRINLHTSKEFFLYALIEKLHRAGVTVSTEYEYEFAPVDTTAQTLAVYYHTLQDALQPMMKKSDNLSAEAIFYHLAIHHSGSKRAVGGKQGVEAIEAFIDSLGFDHADYRIADGSGVSLYNYVSPELLIAFLKHAYSHSSVYPLLHQALPIAGVDGTLEYRMKSGRAHNNVRAKTGTVTGINSLAGYATASNGHTLAFVVINQNTLEPKKARAFQNKICEELCR